MSRRRGKGECGGCWMGHLEVLGENGEHGAPKDPSREGNWDRSQITEASFIQGQRGVSEGSWAEQDQL